MRYEVPCSRRDHDDGDWSRAVMPWSGTLLRPRAEMPLVVEHQPRFNRRAVVLTEDMVVEAVGLSWDPSIADGPESFASALFFIRTGPYAGMCVHSAPAPQNKSLPDGFEVVLD